MAGVGQVLFWYGQSTRQPPAQASFWQRSPGSQTPLPHTALGPTAPMAAVAMIPEDEMDDDTLNASTGPVPAPALMIAAWLNSILALICPAPSAVNRRKRPSKRRRADATSSVAEIAIEGTPTLVAASTLSFATNAAACKASATIVAALPEIPSTAVTLAVANVVDAATLQLLLSPSHTPHVSKTPVGQHRPSSPIAATVSWLIDVQHAPRMSKPMPLTSPGARHTPQSSTALDMGQQLP